MAFFPFMIQMQDKLCVIGGGGKVAYRKVSMMLSFGARVTVIAPKICDELQKIESKQDALLLVQRPFEDGDIEGADVVIMSLSARDTDRRPPPSADMLQPVKRVAASARTSTI